MAKFFWSYCWDMTSSCWHKRCSKYSNFVRFLRLLKRIILKSIIFFLLHRYKLTYNSRNNNWLMTYNRLCNEHFKHWKKCVFFKVTSQKHCRLMYINHNQRYSDNKYLNKRHNIIKGLSETLNFNKSTKNVMSKRLLYPDFKNSHVDIKLKLLVLTCKSM